MTAQNIYPLSLNGDTFNALKSDYDAMLRQTLTKMEDLKVEDATITVKVAVTLEKDQARDFQANGYDAMRDIVKPTFKHEISTVMQVKDKKSGSLGGTMELVWDQELGQYVMRPIDNGQTTLFDQPGEGSGPIMDAEYTVVDDPPALPAGTAALPAPQEEPEVAGLDSEETKERWDTFYWLLNFDGTPMKVLEAMGNYTVRTEANKVILTSANPHTTLYCSGEILSSHVGHRLVCKASGPEEGGLDTVSIICEECDETLFVLHSPAWSGDDEVMDPGDGFPVDSEAEGYPYEEPGEEGGEE